MKIVIIIIQLIAIIIIVIDVIIIVIDFIIMISIIWICNYFVSVSWRGLTLRPEEDDEAEARSR